MRSSIVLLNVFATATAASEVQDLASDESITKRFFEKQRSVGLRGRGLSNIHIEEDETAADLVKKDQNELVAERRLKKKKVARTKTKGSEATTREERKKMKNKNAASKGEELFVHHFPTIAPSLVQTPAPSLAPTQKPTTLAPTPVIAQVPD